MPGHHAHRHHRHGPGQGRSPSRRGSGDRIVGALDMLSQGLGLPDVDALAEVAARIPHGGVDAAAYLRASCRHNTIELAIAKLSLKLWEDGDHRWKTLIERAAQPDAQIVIVTPLPPHRFDDLMGISTNPTIVALEGHEPPPMYLHLALCQDPIEARRAVRSADLIAFDAHAGGGGVKARHHLVDLLDPAVLKPGVELGVHYRPHPKPDDAHVDPSLVARFIEI